MYSCALEMEEEKENNPPPKKPRLSLSLKKKHAPKSARFAQPTAVGDLENAMKGVQPQNTSKNNEWALKNFTQWSTSRSIKVPDNPVPEDILTTHDADLLCDWLSRYVLETRQSSGEPYPPKSIYSLLCGLLRVARERGSVLNFLDKTDVRFRKLHLTMDSVCSKLHSESLQK